MALGVIEVFGRYFNLDGWSGRLAAGMLAAAALLLAIAAVEAIRQKVKSRRAGDLEQAPDLTSVDAAPDKANEAPGGSLAQWDQPS